MENVGQGQWTYRVLSDGGLTDACEKKKVHTTGIKQGYEEQLLSSLI